MAESGGQKDTRRLARWWLALLPVLAVAGYFAWDGLWRTQEAVAAYELATVQRGDLEDVVTATGTLQPRDYVDVGAQVSGQLHRIHVEIGSEVEEGELLAEIDPTLFLARVDASRAQLRFQRAQLQEREASLTLAQIQYRRQQNLLAEDATTAEALQNAEATLRSAQAQIAMLRAQIEQTEQTESTLRADEANLGYAQIYAPMSGTVVSITARQGQTINATQQAPIILRIADLSTMTVEAQVSEADVSRLRVGMAAWFTTLGDQQRRWQGSLRRIEPTPVVESNVVLYKALFEVENRVIDNGDRALLPQMTAQVFFVIAAAREALLVPTTALSWQGGEGEPGVARPATVQVLQGDGTLARREVSVGVYNRVQAQILSGLEEGEQVALLSAAGRSRANAAGAGPAGGIPRLR